MPVVHPAELWQATGRWYDIDATMARFVDRRGRDLLLAMTHEEVVAFHAASEIQSYRQLPAMVYHMQTKFRDELRSRGGLIRVREFTMKDSYSLDRDPEGLAKQYDRHYEAYERIGRRCGLPLTAVLSDTGMMGGKIAHEFMYVTPIGEDSLALCDACGYAANREVAEFTLEPREGEMLPLESVHTPGTATIEEVTGLLGISAPETGKMVFYMGTFVGVEPEAAIFVVDRWVAESPNLVLGANETDYHLRNVCCGRDYAPTVIGSVALAFEGAPCGRCGEGLRMARGVEVGNIFQLGTRYSEGLGATYTDENGAERPIWMGSYGIGTGRLLACVAEEHRDDYGLKLPISVAPYHVSLVALAREEETWAAADRVFAELCAAGIDVIYDDRRKLRAGVKFNDADLRGLPLRLVIGERSLETGGAELSHRGVRESRIIPLDDLVAELRQEIDTLMSEFALDH